jgi:hypothetical protein
VHCHIYGMPAATPWQMQAMIRGRCKIGLAIVRSNKRYATPSFRQRGSRTFGAANAGRVH